MPSSLTLTTGRTSSHHLTAIGAALALGTLLTACADDPTSPASSPSLGKAGATAATILYSGTQSGGQKVYVMNADGSNVRLLTDGAGSANDRQPNYAPGNKRFIWQRYSGDEFGYGEIWTAAANGSRPTQLTPQSMRVANPEYSPDGTKIAFDGIVAGDTKKAIFVMNADGTGVTQLTFVPISQFHPTWSPDGQTIAYEQADPTNPSFDIYSVPATGGSPTLVADCDAPRGCTQPVWSHTGSQILVFDGASQRFRVFELTGAGVTSRFVGEAVALNTTDDMTWTADDSRILFTSNRLGTWDIYSIASSDPTDASVGRVSSLVGNEEGVSASR